METYIPICLVSVLFKLLIWYYLIIYFKMHILYILNFEMLKKSKRKIHVCIFTCYMIQSLSMKNRRIIWAV
jgi:hypothetical protein